MRSSNGVAVRVLSSVHAHFEDPCLSRLFNNEASTQGSLIVVEHCVASNDDATINASILLGFTASHCASTTAAEYYLDRGDGTQGGVVRMEPILMDEERDVACFAMANKTVRRLQVDAAKLAKTLPQGRTKAVFISFGDSLCLRSNEFTIEPE